MKTQWICRWQYIPGREKHFEVYATLDEARHAMAKVLADGIDLSGYIHALRNEEGEDCGSSADFLEKFLSDLMSYYICRHCQSSSAIVMSPMKALPFVSNISRLLFSNTIE